MKVFTNSATFLLAAMFFSAGFPSIHAQVSGPNVPLAGLKAWFRADAGVTRNGSGVAAWTDQSGSGTTAAQATAANQPAYVTGSINGLPALRFNGTSQFLTFNLPLNGLSGMTLVLVSAAGVDTDGSSNGVSSAPLFWNETASWGTVHLSPFPRMVKYRFGTGQINNLPIYTRPAAIGSSYSLATAIKAGTSESLFVNGTQVLTQTGKLATIANVSALGNIGRGYNNNTYFTGQIAEVLIYNRALTATERQQVEQYLLAKYFAAPVPVPSAPTVSAGSPQTITLPTTALLNGTATAPVGQTLTTTWSQLSGPGSVNIANPNALTTTASFSVAGTYSLNLRATSGGQSANSTVTINVLAAPPVTSGALPCPSGSVTISPGTNIQSVINAHSAGSTFCFQAGVHLRQSIVPRSGDTYLGQLDGNGNRLTILNGAKSVNNWLASGGYWVAFGQGNATTDTIGSAACLPAYPACRYESEVFYDGAKLLHVASKSALGAGKWWLDTATLDVWLFDPPAGHTVEVSVTPVAVQRAAANNVTIRNLVFEKYAGVVIDGSQAGQQNWLVQNNEIRLSHDEGVTAGPGSRVLNNYIHHLGRTGMGCQQCDYAVFDGNEVGFANDAGYDYTWDAGATKWLRTQHLTVRNNYTHDDHGPGFWFDYENRFVTAESNRSSRDMAGAITSELSCDMTFRYNVIENTRRRDYLPFSGEVDGIAGYDSPNVEIHHNLMFNVPDGTGGLQDASRPGSGTTCAVTWAAGLHNLYVHDNVTVQSATNNLATGLMSISPSTYPVYSVGQANNRWVNNTYVLYSATAPLFHWGFGNGTWLQWQGAGNDTGGQLAPAGFVSTRFDTGSRPQTTAPTAIYSLPSSTDGTLLGTAAAGSFGTVTQVRGPIYNEGAWWWQVRYDSGPIGWSKELTLH